jgi:hypothetical protein
VSRQLARCICSTFDRIVVQMPLAKRRRGGMRGFAGALSSGLSDMLGLMLQAKMIGGRQNAASQRQRRPQLDEARARAEVATLTPDPPVAERVASLLGELAKIDNPDDPRLMPEGIRKRAPWYRLDPDVAVGELGSLVEAQRQGILASPSVEEGDFEVITDPATGTTRLVPKSRLLPAWSAIRR